VQLALLAMARLHFDSFVFQARAARLALSRCTRSDIVHAAPLRHQDRKIQCRAERDATEPYVDLTSNSLPTPPGHQAKQEHSPWSL
jgi:hypothetical protein